MGRPREFEEDEVIADALEAFWKQGYASTSIQDLLTATDLERGSLYKAFGDKHSLFKRALETYLLEARRKMKETLEGESPLEALKAWLDGLIVACSGAHGPPGCLAVNAMVELAAADASVRELMTHHWSVVERTLESTLARGQARGQMRTDIPARQLAHLVARLAAGVAVFARQGSKSDITSTVLALVRR